MGMVLLGWCLAQLAYNAVLAALVAVLADEIPASRRGTVVGVLGMCIPVGQIAGTFLVQRLAFDLLLALLVPGVIGLVGIWALAFALGRSRAAEPPEAVAHPEALVKPAAAVHPEALVDPTGAAHPAALAPPEAAAHPVDPAAVVRPAGVASAPRAMAAGSVESRAPAEAGQSDAQTPPTGSNDTPILSHSDRRLNSRPPRHRDFSWAWSSRALFAVGSVSFQAYQPFLLLDALGFAPDRVPSLVFGSTLVHAAMTVICSLLAGRLSDRWRRRKPIAMVGALLQGAGLWLVAMADSYTMLLCGVAVAGVGYGAYEGVDLALVTDVLPDRDEHAAKYLGILNIANALPQVVAPLAAPAILTASHGNYSLLFLIAGALPMLAAALLVPVRGAR
jgi:MFS family permease